MQDAWYYARLTRGARWSALALGLFSMVTVVGGCANSTVESCEGESPNPTYQCCEASSGPAWIDVFNDPRNCGGCGTNCGVGGICRAGRCEGGTDTDGGTITPRDGGGTPGMCTPSCSSSQFCCGTTCVLSAGVAPGANGQTDPSFMNCGFCGHTCNPERASACSRGTGETMPSCRCGTFPQCGAGQTCGLDGTAYRCINTSTDPMNCGSVGNACGTNEDCVAGTCTPRMCGGVVCGAGETCCGTTCVNTQTDVNNCGACGTACVSGELCTAGMCTCGGDVCERPMPGMFGFGGTCGEICCADTCVPHDTTNCGTCGTACSGTDVCGQMSDFLTMMTGPVMCGDPEGGGGGFSMFTECGEGGGFPGGGDGGLPFP